MQVFVKVSSVVLNSALGHERYPCALSHRERNETIYFPVTVEQLEQYSPTVSNILEILLFLSGKF